VVSSQNIEIMSKYDKYQVVIGLEVHAQLLTKSKAYSWESTEYGSLPNTNISVVTLGHPGVLPKANKQVFNYAIKMGLAIGSAITEKNIYARKNYFYPDLPKGYQITQDKDPICVGGKVMINLQEGIEKTIGVTRIHMEEDAGKSLHLAEEADTLIDFNRAGVPLIEIVSEPDLRSAEEAGAYLTEVRKLVRYLEICDGNMEEGSFRCDANISVMLKGSEEFGTRVEVKNMNSIRNVQRAINFEFKRQIDLIEAGQSFNQETRTFDATTGETYAMRTKETMNDYRYFPEPDLTPVIVDKEWIESIKKQMPPLPRELYEKFVNNYKLPEYDAGVLTDTKEIALYFEELVSHTKNYKAASNWIMGGVKSFLNERTLHIKDFPVSPEKLASLIQLIDEGKVSNSVASQKIFPILLDNPEKTPLQIAQENNLIQESDTSTLQKLIDEVLAEFPDKVAAYKKGKKGLAGMFMGQIMKRSKGKADPKLTNKMLSETLEKI